MSRLVEAILRIARRGGTKVVERRVADGTSAFSLLFAGPAIAWRMFTTIAPEERVSWIIWTVIFAFRIPQARAASRRMRSARRA
jgi:hypothetical protein